MVAAGAALHLVICLAGQRKALGINQRGNHRDGNHAVGGRGRSSRRSHDQSRGGAALTRRARSASEHETPAGTDARSGTHPGRFRPWLDGAGAWRAVGDDLPVPLARLSSASIRIRTAWRTPMLGAAAQTRSGSAMGRSAWRTTSTTGSGGSRSQPSAASRPIRVARPRSA